MLSPLSVWWTPAASQMVEHDRAKSTGGASGRRRRLPSAASRSSISSFRRRRHHAVRRQALDRERAGDADARIVHVGRVVEIFDVGARGDRGVDLASAGRCALPTSWREAPRLKRARRRAGRAGFAILPSSCRGGVERGAQRFEHRLPLLPDDVDLGVVGDRLQRDVRHALIDEALADIVVGRRCRAAACR